MVIIELICGLVNLKGKQRRSSNDKAFSTGNCDITIRRIQYHLAHAPAEV